MAAILCGCPKKFKRNPETCALRGLPSRSGVRQRQQQAHQFRLQAHVGLAEQGGKVEARGRNPDAERGGGLLRRIAVQLQWNTCPSCSSATGQSSGEAPAA